MLLIKRIKLPAHIQRKLLENYKKQNHLTWGEMAERLKVGKSSLRYFYRNGKRTIPKFAFEKIIKQLPKSRKNMVIRLSETIEKTVANDKVKLKRNSRKMAIVTMKKKYGKNFFRIIGKKGAVESKEMWDFDRRIKQSIVGKIGGRKKIENIVYFNTQEKELSIENKKLDLNFKANHFISSEINFDFVYENDSEEIIGVEEVMNTPLRQIANLLEKHRILKSINKNIPFIVSFDKCNNYDLIFLLIRHNIFPLFSSNRNEYISQILYGTNRNRANIISSIKKELFNNIQKKSNNSNSSALKELKKDFDKYEKLVNDALEEMNLNPEGKTLIKTINGFSFVVDNRFCLNKKPINIIISCSNSRGSLFYSFYNHSSYGLLFKGVCKYPQKTMSIIFDFSNTASGYSYNNPRKLWLKYCDHNILINEYDINKLKNLIKNSINRISQ